MKKTTKVALGALLALIILAWFWAANPLNLFVRKSDRFSKEKFLSIQTSSNIRDAINLLGEPILVRKSLGLTCKNCMAYHFMGDPPRWLISYQEAWLLVDRQGRVVTVTLNSEP